jgi:hypothetical protein
MIRRLEIAQSTLHRPPLLFLDEPTVGLDPIARKAVWEHIVRLRAEFGTTIFLTTHYMEEAEHLCGRVAIMHRGRVVIDDSPERLKASVGDRQATLGDVFIHYAGDTLDSGGTYRETSRVGQLLTMPLFLASNAIYPIGLMPEWLRVLSRINPLSYEVDALRALMLQNGASTFGLPTDYAVLLLTTAVLVVVGAYLYPRVVL